MIYIDMKRWMVMVVEKNPKILPIGLKEKTD